MLPYSIASTSHPGGVSRPSVGRSVHFSAAAPTVGPPKQAWPVLAQIEDQEAAKHSKDAELEAERLWWSEASERQVKELESTFGIEFQKTCSRLRADLEECQDRLEMRVEAEKQQRHASMTALKREFDAQRFELKRLGDRVEAGFAILNERKGDTQTNVNDVHAVLALWKPTEADPTFEDAWEKLKVRMFELEDAVLGLRTGFAASARDRSPDEHYKSAAGTLEESTKTDPVQTERFVLSARVEALEEKLLEHSSMNLRLENLETAFIRVSKDVDIHRFVGDLYRLVEDSGRIASRLDALEDEARKAARDALPLEVRVHAAESVMQRLMHELTAINSRIEAVQAKTHAPPHQQDVSLVKAVTSFQWAGLSDQLEPNQQSHVRDTQPPRSPPAFPNLSDDLKASVNMLLHKVNQTLSEPHGSTVGAEHGVIKGMYVGCSSADTSAGGVLLRQVPDKLDTPSAQKAFLEALHAVQELRESNLALREENAGLVEELLAQDGFFSPSGSVRDMRWTPSAQQSTCATPTTLCSQPAQLASVSRAPGAQEIAPPPLLRTPPAGGVGGSAAGQPPVAASLAGAGPRGSEAVATTVSAQPLAAAQPLGDPGRYTSRLRLDGWR